MACKGFSPRLVSELQRERETCRYDRHLSPSYYRYVRDGDLPRTSDLVTAPDSVLTALAQLGACQTRTARAFISLFDSTHQYIVAEASPSIRIAAKLPSDDCSVSLSLCGTAIPRSQGTCEHVLNLATKTDSATKRTELPLSIVPNLAEDPRFISRPYCQLNRDGQFYAGVPIRTRKGIDIGSYCVMHPSMPSGWNEQYEQHLRDISRAIMTHLEFRRSSFENQRYERFARGLSTFIEDNDTVQDAISSPCTPDISANKDEPPTDQTVSLQPATSSVTTEHVEKCLITDQIPVPPQTSHQVDTMVPAYPTTPSRHDSASSAGHLRSHSLQSNVENPRDPDRIFSRAARIIHSTFAAEGCVLLGVPLGSYRPPSPSGDEEISTTQGFFPTSNSVDHPSDVEHTDGICDILGISVTSGFEADEGRPTAGIASSVPSAFLTKFFSRYPNGRIFDFDASGDLQPGDSSEDELGTRRASVAESSLSGHPGADNAKPTASDKHQTHSCRKPIHRQEEAGVLQRAFPGARSVMFIPVWDPKRERWLSGGFVYSLAASHQFSYRDELGLALAFSKVISAEFLNIEALRTEKVKSDALGSLSHELRSPLHGIILSTEMLNNTDLTAYQGNSTHTIETCCRTLLDTIDHLLVFSKVNSLAQSSSTTDSLTPTRPLKRRSTLSFFGNRSLYKHLRVDELVEDVVTSVFAGFNFEHLSPERFGPSSTLKSAVLSDSSAPLAGAFYHQSPHKERHTTVAVYVTADPACNWMLQVQAGALRRIIMNLFGNSLKHTTRGTIQVALSQENSGKSATPKSITLTVSDTGSGIGKDFLEHSLFQPFSQENELSPGIGLGLSLVKKIVSQLRGRIKVQSQVGVGTTIQVKLPLVNSMPASQPQAEAMTENGEVFEEEIRDLTGRSIAIRGFGSEWGPQGYHLVETLCRRWLKLRLADDDESSDVMLRSEDTLAEAYTTQASLLNLAPMIVVCRDAPAAWRLSKAYETGNPRHVVEFVSQPIAPRVLARAILHAYRRWIGIPDLMLVPRPESLRRTHSLGAEQISPMETATSSSLTDHDCLSPSETESNTQAQLSRQVSVHDKPSTAKEHLLPTISFNGVKKLLLVDDNYINLKVLSAIVANLGHEYEVATNGEEALNEYLRCPHQFSGVLMDISMPIMDGLEATRRIRAHERGEHLAAVPVLALTGLSSESTHMEALESGVNVFLTKPVQRKTLRDAMASVGLTVL